MEKAFFGGVPTNIEVRALREAYPDDSLTQGRLIPYPEIEALIKCPRDSNRWRSVTDRWRKTIEREVGVIIAPDPMKSPAWKILLENEKVVASGAKLKTAGRMARRSYVLASRVDVKQLTEQEKAEYDHFVMRSTAVIMASRLRPKVALPEVV
jgi:hypothetical protein